MLKELLVLSCALIVYKLTIFTVFQSHATFTRALQGAPKSPVSMCAELMIDRGDHLGFFAGVSVLLGQTMAVVFRDTSAFVYPLLSGTTIQSLQHSEGKVPTETYLFSLWFPSSMGGPALKLCDEQGSPWSGALVTLPSGTSPEMRGLSLGGCSLQSRSCLGT